MSILMPIFRQRFEAMGSAQCEIVLAAPDQETAHRCATASIEEVHRIQKKYSRYEPDSIIAQLNAEAGCMPILCDEETLDLLNYAETLYQHSEGLFDITSGILRQAWDFKTPILPTESTLEPLLNRIGFPKIKREGESVLLTQMGMEIDLGGFGKEYATDRAAAVLKKQGIEHGYVNLAGDIRILGSRPDGEPWQIGIQHPRENQLMAVLPMRGEALATSGDYERFFELNGKRYCHILNPQTGYPVSYWQSISVVAPMALAAGSYSTLAMLKEADALAFLDAAGVAYLAVDHSGHVYESRH